MTETYFLDLRGRSHRGALNANSEQLVHGSVGGSGGGISNKYTFRN